MQLGRIPDEAALDAGLILEAIGEPVLVHDAEDGTVLWCNRAATELLGRRPGDRPADPAGACQFASVGSYGPGDVIGQLRRARAEGPTVFSWTALRPDGAELRLEISLRPIGMPSGRLVLAVVRDRTAQELELERLAETDRAVTEVTTRFIDLAADDLGPGLDWACRRLGGVLSADGCHAYVVDARAVHLKRVGRWNASAGSYQPAADEFPTSVLDPIRNALEHETAVQLHDGDGPWGGNPLARQMMHRFGVGSCLIAPVTHNGMVMGVIAAISGRVRTWEPHHATMLRLVANALANVLVRHRQELDLRQRQKMDALGQLAGGIAHDFNNMLTGILGFADMLRLQLSDRPQAAEAAQRIADAAERAAELTSKLLTFARRGSRSRQTLDLHRVITDAVFIAEHTMGRGVAITQSLQAGRPWVLGDATLLESALLNLLLNARDAMPGGGRVTVATRDRDDQIELTVTDTGVGMSPDVLDRIFEPFFTTKDAGRGTGLGLPAVYGTVREHAGSIQVDSTPGNGTRFTIMLPIAGRPRPAQRIGAAGTAPARVLVVDDEPSVRHATADMLRSLGWEVVEAADGDDALAQLAGPGSFGAAVVDVMMPGRAGPEVAGLLRQRDPRLPVLFVSGFSGTTDVASLSAQPQTGFLAKPFRSADLARAIGSLNQPA